jgi:DNA oxidative demethylase
VTAEQPQPPRRTVQRTLPLAPSKAPEPRAFAAGAVLLPAFASAVAPALADAIDEVTRMAPWRRMLTPGGRAMSVSMSNCGALGWVSDARGYRYAETDPTTGRAWPPMPNLLRELATSAAAAAGHVGFAPDACLLNRYEPGARMALHQDRDERDFTQPIVSVSLGLPAVFRFGGLARSAPTQRLVLEHGDVVVFGGPSRLCFHGIQPVRAPEGHGEHERRLNLTFRVAG